MELTKRQEKILNTLVQGYINTAEPISSKLLKKRAGLDVCEATIRNELQELTERGYIAQPHTSAGRVPTNKAYHYFVDKLFDEDERLFSDFIAKEIEIAKKHIEDELKLAEELTRSLTEVSLTFTIAHPPQKDNLLEILTMIGPSRITYEKNISLINSLIKELEEF
jgi:heat shock gene repressor HrcA